MTKIKTILAAFLTLFLGSTFAANTEENEMQMSAPSGMEKCYGIAKAGLNDCSTALHSCSGEAKIDGGKGEWLAVPEGLCDKIVGGSLKSAKP